MLGWAVVSLFEPAISFKNTKVVIIQDVIDNGDADSAPEIFRAIIDFSKQRDSAVVFSMFFNERWSREFTNFGALSSFGSFSRFLNTYQYKLTYQTSPQFTSSTPELNAGNSEIHFGNGDGAEHFFA